MDLITFTSASKEVNFGSYQSAAQLCPDVHLITTRPGFSLYTLGFSFHSFQHSLSISFFLSFFFHSFFLSFFISNLVHVLFLFYLSRYFLFFFCFYLVFVFVFLSIFISYFELFSFCSLFHSFWRQIFF